MSERISFSEAEKTNLSLIIEEFKYRIAEFVPKNKTAAALVLIAALGTGCARIRENQETEPKNTQQIEMIAPVETGEVQQEEIKPTDSSAIEAIREQIAQEQAPKLQQEIDISETDVLSACEEIMTGQYKVDAINIIAEKKILAALAEIPNDGVAETEEATTYQALIFKIDENNNLKLISKFGIDAFDVPKYEMEHNEAIATSGLNLDELKWLVRNSSESEDLISIK